MQKYKTYEVDFSTHLANIHNTLWLDRKLLSELLTIRAPSKKEGPVSDYILNFIVKNSISCKVEVDYHGNLFIVKGKNNLYPCIIAHMDEVCGDVDARVVIDLGNIMVGLDPNTGESAGCPGDDRVGVYCALELLRVLPHCKICFFVEEEIGAANGSKQADLTFFKDCTFILQADRTDNYEWITDSNGGQICSNAFTKASMKWLRTYSYEESTFGSFTDCGVLSSRGVGISCVNLGAGYYDSHSSYEKVCINDVENVLNLMYSICLHLSHKRWLNIFDIGYAYKYERPKQSASTYISKQYTNQYKSSKQDEWKDWDDIDDISVLDVSDFPIETDCEFCQDFSCSECTALLAVSHE